MFCPNCGAQALDGDVFCPGCGQQLPAAGSPAQPPAPGQPPLPAAPRKPLPVAIIALAVVIGLAGLGGIGWAVWASTRGGSSASSGDGNKTEPAKSKETTKTAEETETATTPVKAGTPEATIDAFYVAVAEGDWDGVLATFSTDLASAADPGMFEGWSAPSYTYLGSEETPDGGTLVSVQEYDGGLSNGVVDFLLVREAGSWKITEWFLGDVETGGGGGTVLDRETAANVVGELLFALQSDDIARAKELATENFRTNDPNFFYPASQALDGFEVSDVFEDGGTYVVVMREQWNSGPEEISYIVVEEGGEAKVDSVVYP